jgi:hypothetical protein
MEASFMRISVVLAVVSGLTVPAGEPKKVNVFLTESGAMEVAGLSMTLQEPTSTENIEVVKAFQRHCPAAALTSERDKADYVIRLDHESRSTLSPFVRGNKVAVFNRNAALVYTNASRTLAPAVKGACAVVMARK